MLQQSTRMVNFLAETLYDLDVREAPRFDCPTKPTLRIMVRPSFVPVNVTVNDISSKGIGLVCEKHLESGADLAVLWKYGTADRWRTLRARVVRLAPRRDGTWVAGCVPRRNVGGRLRLRGAAPTGRHGSDPADSTRSAVHIRRVNILPRRLLESQGTAFVVNEADVVGDMVAAAGEQLLQRPRA